MKPVERLKPAAVLVALLAAALLLSGCPAVPVKMPEVEPWDIRRAQLQARERFELSARVAVAAGNDGFNARLRWEQDGQRSNVALDGPLGVGGVRVAAEGASLSITTSRGEQLDADAARAELIARLGFEPPLGSLRYWVLGVPDPAQPATEEVLDPQQRLVSLQQDGWRIEYGGYKAVGGEWLPEKITFRRDEVRVRMIVDRWSS